MKRLLVPLVLVPTLIFVLLISIIQAQPYPEVPLMEANCLTPCFLGIHPGSTTIQEAVALLEAQNLVAEWVIPFEGSPSRQQNTMRPLLIWRWSDRQPAYLTHPEATLLYDWQTERVAAFSPLITNIPLADILIHYGQPQAGFMNAMLADSGQRVFIHVASYMQPRLTVISYTTCPMTLHHLWQTPVRLEINNIQGDYSRLTAYPEDIRPLLETADRTFCG